jgi:hypothetical protein
MGFGREILKASRMRALADGLYGARLKASDFERDCFAWRCVASRNEDEDLKGANAAARNERGGMSAGL